MNFKKVVSLVLALALGLTPVILTGCDGDGDKEEEEKVEAITKLPLSFGEELKDFEGMKYNILTRTDRGEGQAFNIVDIGGENNYGDETIVEAVQTRNDRLKAVFNFEVNRVDKQNAGGEADKAINQRDKSYKAFMLGVQEGLKKAKKGALVDFNYTTYLDTSREYWDSAIIENLLLLGGAYIALGDINTVDEDATWCVLFNKELWESISGEEASTLYNTVKAGNWTVQTMKSFAQEHYIPGESDALKYEVDYAGAGTYGFSSQNSASMVIMQASGNTPTKLDESEVYGFRDNMTGNNNFSTAVDIVHSLFGGTDKKEWQLNADKDIGNVDNLWRDIMRGGFKRDRVLFFFCHVGTIDLIRDMDSDFGILPIPKLTSDQEKYGNTIQYDNATCYVIPSFSLEEDDDAAYALEAMCYYSSPSYCEAAGIKDDSLRYAYRINVLERKATRDDESMEMLDLVFNNRVFDITLALDLGGINASLIECCTSNTTPDLAVFLGNMPNISDLMKNELKELQDVILGNS